MKKMKGILLLRDDFDLLDVVSVCKCCQSTQGCCTCMCLIVLAQIWSEQALLANWIGEAKYYYGSSTYF